MHVLAGVAQHRRLGARIQGRGWLVAASLWALTFTTRWAPGSIAELVWSEGSSHAGASGSGQPRLLPARPCPRSTSLHHRHLTTETPKTCRPQQAASLDNIQ